MSDDLAKDHATDLNRPMQAHVVAMCLRQPGFMARVRPVMNPDYFDDTALADLVAWANQHWDENKETPSKQALLDTFADHAELIRSLWRQELNDPKYTVSRIVGYAKMRAVRNAIFKAGEHLQSEMAGQPYRNAKGKVETIDYVKTMQEALQVGADTSSVGENFDATLEEDIREIISPTRTEKILTGLGHLDEAGVSIERGELGCVLGASKRGKSHVLINIAYGALKAGLNVVYYTLEMPSSKVRRRFHLRIAGKTVDIKADPAAFAEKLRERKAKLIRGQMLVKRYHSRGATVDDIRSHLAQVTSQGFKPDVVIVDYGGILRPVKPTGELRHDLAEIFVQLRAIAGEFGVGMWTAAQANRGSVNKDVVTMQDFAECFEIVQHLDVGFSVCMTDDEKSRGEGRFFVLASRNDADGTIVTFEHDYSRTIITTTGVQRAVAEKKRRDKDSGGSGPSAGAQAAIDHAKLRKKTQSDRDNV